MSGHIFTKKTLSKQNLSLLSTESKEYQVTPLKVISLLIAIYSLFALIFEVRYYSEFTSQIFITRLSAAGAAFSILVLLFTPFGSKKMVLMVHSLLIVIIISSGYITYLIPSTLLINVQIISLLIFTSALFLSWEVKNQIIVSIYYVGVFAAALSLNGIGIYYLNNIYETIVFVLFLSLISIIGSSVNFKLRQELVNKSNIVRSSEKKYKSIFENSTEGIFQSTPEGNFITANPALIEMLGYGNLNELLSLNIEKDIFNDSADRDKLLRVLRRENVVSNYKTALKKKDGNIIIVKIDDRILKNEKEEIYFEGNIRDISEQAKAEEERKKAEIALRQEKIKSDQLAKDAQKANSIKSQFLAHMSHEIRTPINGILGLLELIQSDSYKNNEELKQMVADAKTSAEALLGIINNILDLSKLEAGKMELEEAEFDLDTVLNDSISVLRNRANEKGLIISSDLPKDFSVLLRGDSLRLKQIFINLIGNAIKFTEKGTVSVGAKLKEISGEFVSLDAWVEDTGVGIPPEKKEDIFKPFSQLGEAGKHRGTGLGLAICREFISMMGGEISVESEEKKGSKFKFSVKLRYKKKPERVEKNMKTIYELPKNGSNGGDSELLKNQRANFKILLAEDNLINQKVAMKILNSAGYMVEAVGNGREAVAAVSKGAYDVVLMDIQMPEMDGFSATKEIREFRDEKNKVPIIAITAHALRGDKEKCLEAGMNDYISKPIIAPQLIRILDKWTNLNSAQPVKKTEADVPGSDIFDFEHFEKISIGDKEFQRDLLESYFSDVELRIQKLDTHLAVKDFQHTINEAHTIKGASLSIGALKVGEQALAVEISGKNNDHTRAMEKFFELKKAFESTREALRKKSEIWV